MFINIKSDYSTAEIERILSSKRNVKYMRKYVDYDLGINWCRIEKFALSVLQFRYKGHTRLSINGASIFLRKSIQNEKGNRIIGIALPEITFLLLSLVIFIFVPQIWLNHFGLV